ncbi:MAG: hypothetical protein E7419_04355 [Ruminococcaceae bacterium]|nr:hypothetical protein [Oscillospiraceae bacterium]
MKITFFIGNGFDLNQNLKTSYPEFLKTYLPEKEEDSDIVKYFKKKLEQYNCWSDLESSLGKILIHYDEETIDDFIKGLNDIKKCLSLYLSEQEKKFKYKFRKIKKELKRTFAMYYNKKGYLYPFFDLYADNSENNEINFITFNYTKILNKMVAKIRKKRYSFDTKTTHNSIGQVISIHGNTNKGFILGLNDKSQINNDKLKNNDKLLQHIIKSNQVTTMNRCNTHNEVQKIIENSDIIYVYGMSFGETDATYWETIVKWLKTNASHKLIINNYNPSFNPIDMGAISYNSQKISYIFKNYGANTNILEEQVFYIENSTLFNFVKKSKKHRI